jgi:hypothetical protein
MTPYLIFLAALAFGASFAEMLRAALGHEPRKLATMLILLIASGLVLGGALTS